MLAGPLRPVPARRAQGGSFGGAGSVRNRAARAFHSGRCLSPPHRRRVRIPHAARGRHSFAVPAVHPLAALRRDSASPASYTPAHVVGRHAPSAGQAVTLDQDVHTFMREIPSAVAHDQRLEGSIDNHGRDATSPAGAAVAMRFAIIVAALTAGPALLAAQHPEGGRVTTPAAAPAHVLGRVVDAATAEPIPSAAVVLAPLPEGVLSGGTPREPARVAAGRRVMTDSAGHYEFADLSPGSYRLYVSRLGYEPASLDVALAGVAAEVGVGLVVAPITLRPVEVTVPREQQLATAPPGAPYGNARVAAARARQERYLASDVRELTAADVGDAVTLAETDLFRALHRLPGVSTRDEWSAELWTRGAGADQTRVYYDGLPLFAPLHAFGALTAVSPEAVGAAVLHPGSRPASLGEGTAGVLDLRSRAGGEKDGGAVAGRGELSVASARLALNGAAGPVSWAAGARRSYFDLASSAARQFRQADGSYGYPYSFHDAFARADWSLGGGRVLSAGGLVEGDRVHGHSGWGLTYASDAKWGNTLGRVSFATPVGKLRLTQTVGSSAYALDIRRIPRGATSTGGAPAGDTVTFPRYPEPATSAAVRFAAVSGELAPITTSGVAAPWSLGYEVNVQRVRYAGPGRPYYSGDEFTPGDTAIAGGLTVASLWGERRWRAAERLTLDLGLRVEASGARGGAVVVRPAPRLAARYRLGPATTLSATASHAVQYTQALPRLGHTEEARFSPSTLWLLAGESGVPALRADVGTLGVERWLGHGWLGAANTYVRSTRGITTADPSPGFALGRPLFVVGGGAAHGFELSARRLVGRTTVAAAYGYGVSTLRASGLRYPAPEDRTHAVDLTVARRLSPRWRVGGAFSAATGSPFTRAVFVEESQSGGGPADRSGFVLDAPDAERRPPALGLDLAAEWTHRFANWEVSAFGQVHSPLATESTGSYNGSGWCHSLGADGQYCTSGQERDGTLPVLPVLGLRVAF